MRCLKSLRPERAVSRPLVLVVLAGLLVPGMVSAANPDGSSVTSTADVPDPRQAGGESEGRVRVATLVYAGSKSSQCFSDHFLQAAEQESTILTTRSFDTVRMDSEDMFNFPLVIMTGEGSFQLTDQERRMLRVYVERGGLLLASAGCSSPDWDRSFRREMKSVFEGRDMAKLGMNHPVFHTVHDIDSLKAKHGQPKPLEALLFDERIGVIYSNDGLNDTAHTKGCCCCGGNEITNCIRVNVNILAYSLLY